MKIPRQSSFIILIAFVILAIFFGIWGYSEEISLDLLSFWGVLYSTFQMFVLESSDPESINWKLLIARYLAAFIISFGLFILVFNYLRKWHNQFRVRFFFRNHTIICGLGEIGYKLAVDLLRSSDKKRKREKIVVIELNPDNEFISELRSLNAIVINGNALDRSLISRTNLGKASRLVVNTGKDEVNIEIVNAFSDYYFENRYTNRIQGLVHIYDWSNYVVLKDYLESYHDTENFDINIFNLFQSAAQIIFDRYSPFGNTEDIHSKNINIVIWGYNQTAEAFLVENIILGQYAEDKKLSIYITDIDIQKHIDKLFFRFPFAKEFIRVIPIELNNEILEFEKIKEITKEISMAYVFGNEDAVVMNRAKILRQVLYVAAHDINKIPIIACLHEKSNIFELLNLINDKPSIPGKALPVRSRKTVFKEYEDKFNIHFMRLVSDTCTRHRLIDSNHRTDILAKAINYFYAIKYQFEPLIRAHLSDPEDQKKLRDILLQAEEEFIATEFTTQKPLKELEETVLNSLCRAMPEISNIRNKLTVHRTWQPLSDWLKDSNRYSARHLDTKLRLLNKPVLTDDDVNKIIPNLAPVEHKRWCAEKLIFNYRYGPLPDQADLRTLLKNELKIHNLLVDFNQLENKEKDKDLDTFRLIPVLQRISNSVKP